MTVAVILPSTTREQRIKWHDNHFLDLNRWNLNGNDTNTERKCAFMCLMSENQSCIVGPVFGVFRAVVHQGVVVDTQNL